jgi:hypothetical protein
MNQEPFKDNSASLAQQRRIPGTQFQSAPAQMKPARVNQRPATTRVGDTPIASTACHKQSGAKVLQAKMHNRVPAVPSRSFGCSVSGVVQANVVGGNHALHARLNLWNTAGVASRPVGQSRSSSLARSSANSSHPIQRKTGPGVEAFRVPLRQKSGGFPIPNDVRAKMETAFGADFSDVRVHIGQEAASLGAIAYTWGSNIHFAPGQYNPYTLQGQKLLGHELWHVVQQKSGRVKNPFGGGVAVVQDHALEAEADRMGIKAALTQIVRTQAE